MLLPAVTGRRPRAGSAALVLFGLSGACAGDDGNSSTEPEDTPVAAAAVAETASPGAPIAPSDLAKKPQPSPESTATVDPAPSMTSETPAPVAAAGWVTASVVTLQTECSESACIAADGSNLEAGAPITEVAGGTAECAGWAPVVTANGTRGWLQLRHASADDAEEWVAALATATRGDVIELLGESEAACVRAALDPDRFAAALERSAIDEAPWMGAAGVLECVGPDLAAALISSGLLADLERDYGIASDDIAACTVSYAVELVDLGYDAATELMSAEILTSRIAAAENCAGPQLMDSVVGELAAVIGIDPERHAQGLDCLRNAPALQEIVFSGSRTGCGGSIILNTVIDCAMDAMIEVVLLGVQASEAAAPQKDVDCARENITAELLKAAASGRNPTATARLTTVIATCTGQAQP